MITFKDMTIIVPMAPKEAALADLLEDLHPISNKAEILVVGTEENLEKNKIPPLLKRFKKGRYLSSQRGRALQMNTGAAEAKNSFLWFLHADSRLIPKTLTVLLSSLQTNPKALHYFILEFLPDGPPFMFINEIGCWIRSRVMGAPFGDQGFCLSKENFKKIGGFPEAVPYGEDHLFVWCARKNGIRLNCVNAILKTSARRYADTGWARLTWRHGHRWIRQAFPQWLLLLQKRLFA